MLDKLALMLLPPLLPVLLSIVRLGPPGPRYPIISKGCPSAVYPLPAWASFCCLPLDAFDAENVYCLALSLYSQGFDAEGIQALMLRSWNWFYLYRQTLMDAEGVASTACLLFYRLRRRVGTMNLDTCTTVPLLEMIWGMKACILLQICALTTKLHVLH